MCIDILVLLLLSTSFFELTPFEGIFQGNNPFTFLLLYMAFMYMKYMGFTFRAGIGKHLVPEIWILVSLLLSFIPAYLYYGQHLYHSVVVYRKALVFLSLPLLLSIRPTIAELRGAFYIYGFVYALSSFLATYVFTTWWKPPEGMDYVIDSDPLMNLSGLLFVVISLILALDEYRKTHKRKHLALSVFLFLVIFLVQNRTMLLCSVAIVIAATLFDLPARTRIIAEFLLIVFIVLVVFMGWSYFWSLFQQTMTELSDEDYNRVKAFHYFTTPTNGWMSFLWGNGFISGNVNSLMADLGEEGIFHSDLGMVGLWNQFGLLFPLSVLVYEIKGLSGKHSFHVRGLAIMMLLSTMTMAYYFTYPSILWLCFFYYLMAADDLYHQRKAVSKRKKALRRIRRFRSLTK